MTTKSNYSLPGPAWLLRQGLVPIWETRENQTTINWAQFDFYIKAQFRFKRQPSQGPGSSKPAPKSTSTCQSKQTLKSKPDFQVNGKS